MSYTELTVAKVIRFELRASAFVSGGLPTIGDRSPTRSGRNYDVRDFFAAMSVFDMGSHRYSTWLRTLQYVKETVPRAKQLAAAGRFQMDLPAVRRSYQSTGLLSYVARARVRHTCSHPHSKSARRTAYGVRSLFPP